MDKAQENQNRMGGILDAFLETHSLTASAVAVAEAADVRAAYALVQTSIGQGTTDTRENTDDAGTAETRLLRVLPALLGSLRSVARKLPLTDAARPALLARATISGQQLRKLRPGPLREVVQHLLEEAITHKIALAKYGYSPAVHAVLTKAFDDFAATVGTTKGLLNDNVGVSRSTAALLRDFLKQCYELDDALQIFRVLDEPLYQAYRQARKVGKSGGGKKKKDDGAGPGPA